MKRTLIIFLLFLLLLGVIAVDIYFDDIAARFWPETATVVQQKDEQPATPPAEEPPAPTTAPEQTPPPPPAAEPKPEPPAPVERPLPERPHSTEHAAALRVAQAVEPEAPQAELDRMVEAGSISPEAASAIRTWAQEHRISKVEEVGTVVSQEDGSRETRYRLVAADEGGQDILLSVTTQPQGKPIVTRVQTADADKTRVNIESDPLSVVEGFIEAVKRGDMGAARRLTSGKDISDATLAGLCMMFEEGDFTMRQNMPVRSMFRNGDNAGFLIYMTDANSTQARNVGVELTHQDDRGWTVKAVALDNLLNRYEASGEAEGGVYFPIVKNPQGGDSIVLYFGFNDASLSPRSLSQLKIVASLLRSTSGHLNISGHTDDVGTTAYNQNLSERRAVAVREALISYGVKPEQISTRGLGKSQPLRTYHAGDTIQTIKTIRSSNRRAEIYLDF